MRRRVKDRECRAPFARHIKDLFEAHCGARDDGRRGGVSLFVPVASTPLGIKIDDDRGVAGCAGRDGDTDCQCCLPCSTFLRDAGENIHASNYSTRARSDVSTRARSDVSTRARSDVSTRARSDVSTRARSDVSTRARSDVSGRGERGHQAFRSRFEHAPESVLACSGRWRRRASGPSRCRGPPKPVDGLLGAAAVPTRSRASVLAFVSAYVLTCLHLPVLACFAIRAQRRHGQGPAARFARAAS